MSTNEIMSVFTFIFNLFVPAITIIMSVIAAGIGLRWVIRTFMK